jgi:regulator of sirC expression with transglutaminase-like and TPR domain
VFRGRVVVTGIQGYSSAVHFERFTELFSIRGAVVPLDEALALICHFADDSVDPQAVISELDQLASTMSATSAIELMAELFGPSGFTGNSVEYDDPHNSLLQHVIARRLGIPITLCALAIEVGRRIDIDIVGIGMPGHFLCRTASPSDPAFFDPFHSPRPLSAEHCKMLYENLTQIDNWSAEFLEPSSSRLMVIRVLSNLKSIYRRRSDFANLRWVMRLRSVIPEIAAGETVEFAQLMRGSN